MFEMLNHLHHMETTMHNIHHEMKVQTDLLRDIRDRSREERRGMDDRDGQGRTTEARGYKRPPPSYSAGPTKRFNRR